MEASVHRLYVGNLPCVAQPADVEALFSSNNIPVNNLDMSVDPFTGRSPSYCFVDLNSAQDSQLAMMTLPGQNVRGRPVKVNLFTEMKNGHGSRRPTMVYDRGHRVCKVATPDVKDAYVFDPWSRRDSESHWTAAPIEEHRRLYVGGLPRIPNQDAVNLEISRLFQGFEVQAVSKIIPPHKSICDRPGSHYYCFVDLASPQDALDAIEALDGKRSLCGGQYEVQLATIKRPIKVQREQLGIFDGTALEKRPHRDLTGNWRRSEKLEA